jgi:hypothetical protein
MKMTITIMLGLLLCTSVNAQMKEIVHSHQLDSIYHLNSKQVQRYKVTAKIHSFGKSGTIPIRQLAAAGLLKYERYITSFAVTLLTDTIQYYIPVAEGFFKKWHKRYSTSTLPSTAQLTIAIYPQIKTVKNKYYFVIERVRFLE